MRLTARRDAPRPAIPNPGRGASLPPPTGGWDAISSLADMPPDRAVRLENWFPQPGYIELRRGSLIHADTSTGVPVETIMAYQGPSSDKLFAVSDDTIFDITTAGVATPAVTGLANARFQFTQIATLGGNFLWCCNGADDPRYFDGTVWATAAITGVPGGAMVDVAVYKSRIWTVLKDTTKAAYLPLDSVQGAATEFDVGGEFQLGGYLEAIGTWSTDNNDGPVTYIAFVSSKGEVVIYDIPDPTDPDGITLKAKAVMGAPVGRRCLTKVGADLALICLDGVIPISQALSYDRAALLKVSLTANIQPVMNKSARDYFSNFGWQLIGYPRGTMAILNVPVLEGQAQEQYVMNTVTGAWCRFIGQPANCWEIYDNRPFFGGNTGAIFEADRTGTDQDSAIDADVLTAYNYYNSRGELKRWIMVQPVLRTDGLINPAIAVSTDFQDDGVLATPTSVVEPSALWDQALWDQALWPMGDRIVSRWQSVSGIGYCGAIHMRASVTGAGTSQSLWDQAIWDQSNWDVTQRPPLTLQVMGWNVALEQGALVG